MEKRKKRFSEPLTAAQQTDDVGLPDTHCNDIGRFFHEKSRSNGCLTAKTTDSRSFSPSDSHYKVLIVDDQSISRSYFERFVLASDRYELAASVDTAKFADVYCADGRVDLVLMDVVMNDGSSGLETARRIKTSFPKTKVIIVTSMPDETILRKAREIGADSFWYKEAQAQPMLEVMDRTMAGEHVFPDDPPQVRLGLANSSELTERELEILRCLAEGLTDKEIAGQLHLGFTTVRYHVNNLLEKTGMGSRTELAVNAVRSGITVPGIK